MGLPIYQRLRRCASIGAGRPTNEIVAEAADTINQLCEALEELLESYLDALPGSEDYGPVLNAQGAIAKARGDQ